MLFVVIRDTVELGSQKAVFTRLNEATEVYEEAAYVCRNAPGEGATDDMTIVTEAFLYAVDTTDPVAALLMVADGRATILEHEDG
jgi:hypothetical protein